MIGGEITTMGRSSRLLLLSLTSGVSQANPSSSFTKGKLTPGAIMKFSCSACTGVGLALTPLPTDPSTTSAARAAGATASEQRTRARAAGNHLRILRDLRAG